MGKSKMSGARHFRKPWEVVRMKLKGPQVPPNKWKYKVGDIVSVIHGPYSGQKGKVLECVYEQNKITVQGVATVTRRTPATPDKPGGLFERHRPIPYSDVALLHPITNKPTKSRVVWDEENNMKTRTSWSGHEIPYPKSEYKTRTWELGPNDTPSDVVNKVTYVPSLLSVQHSIMFEMGLTTAGTKQTDNARAKWAQKMEREKRQWIQKEISKIEQEITEAKLI